MTLLPTSPHPPASSAADDAELLFKEAHQRRRRRRIGALVVAAIVAGTAVAVVLTSGNGSHERPAKSQPHISTPPVATAALPPRVAWTDYAGRVHIGSLLTHEQRDVASGTGSPTTSMVASEGTLFWASGGGTVYDKKTNQVRILPTGVMAYDTTTGRSRSFAGGTQVFNAVASADVFVASKDGRHLWRYGLDGRVRAQLNLPNGWYLPDPFGLGTSTPALAHGAFLVQSLSPYEAGTKGAGHSKLAVWTPATGNLRALGGSSFMVATHTDKDGSDSLIAWLPAACATSNESCVVQLTDLATGVTRQVRNPLGFGFDMRGAYSPDGRQLAVFAKTNSGGYNPETRLALIDVATGSMRLVPGATIEIGEAVAWAQWLPGTDRLIAGGTSDTGGLPQANHFVVDAATLHSAPFRFLRDGQQDVNYSVVVLP